MGVSRREYARMRGVSHTAVARAIGDKRITPEPDGTIDPAKADREWAQNTDPSKQRYEAHRVPSAAPVPGESKNTLKPVPKSAIRAVEETIGGPKQEDGGTPSFVRARLANELIKASTAKLRLAKMQGDLVDKNKATAMIFELARRERDTWLSWPSRIAANMAADFQVDPHLVQVTLERYIRDQLADLAEIKLELR